MDNCIQVLRLADTSRENGHAVNPKVVRCYQNGLNYGRTGDPDYPPGWEGGLLLFVDNLMFCEMDLTDKIPPALGADEGRLPRVDGLVRDQIALSGEALSADGASEGLLSGVEGQVVLEAGSFGEDFPTLGTSQFLLSVISPVINEPRFPGKAFRTVRTLESLRGGFARAVGRTLLSRICECVRVRVFQVLLFL